MESVVELTNKDIVQLQQWVNENPEMIKSVYETLCAAYGKTCKMIVNANFSQFTQNKEDLMQEANIIMLQCFKKYDASKGNSFETYFTAYIRKGLRSICYELNNPTKINKNIIIKADKWRKQIDELIGEMTRKEAINYIAQKEDVSPEKINKYLCLLARKNTVSIFNKESDEEDETYISIQDSNGDFFSTLEKESRFKRIEELIDAHCSTELEKKLWRMHLDIYDENGSMTHNEISQRLETSTSFVTEKILKIKKSILANKKDKKELYSLLQNN